MPYTREPLDGEAPLRHLAQRLNEGKNSMKKLALTVTILASLGLAACGSKTEETNTTTTNIEATTENAVTDVTAAENAATNEGNAVETTTNTETTTTNTTNAM